MPKFEINMANGTTEAYESIMVALDVIDNELSDLLPPDCELVSIKFNYDKNILIVNYRRNKDTLPRPPRVVYVEDGDPLYVQ